MNSTALIETRIIHQQSQHFEPLEYITWQVETHAL